MNERVETTKRARPARTTRRETLGRLGSGAALAALVAMLAGGRVLAHEATPAAGEGSAGRYTVIRIRRVKADRSSEELTTIVEEGFVPLVRELPGFVSYVVLWNAETRDWVAISTFTDRAAAEASTAAAAAFGTSSGTNDYVEGDPIVVEGAVLLTVAEGA